MLRAYNQGTATMNLLRAFSRGGLADLNRVHQWNLDFIKDNPLGQKYDELSYKIDKAMKFMKACGIDSKNTPQCIRLHYLHLMRLYYSIMRRH